MGAEVRIFDDNIHKLMRLQNSVGRQLYTSASQPHLLCAAELLTAEVAIGAIHAEERPYAGGSERGNGQGHAPRLGHHRREY